MPQKDKQAKNIQILKGPAVQNNFKIPNFYETKFPKSEKRNFQKS